MDWLRFARQELGGYPFRPFAWDLDPGLRWNERKLDQTRALPVIRSSVRSGEAGASTMAPIGR